MSPTSNYSTLLLAVTWVECICAINLFAGRSLTSWRFTQRFRIDYWLAFLTLIVACVGQAALTVSVHEGLGDRRKNLSNAKISLTLQWAWVAMIADIVAIVTGKLSLIAFLNQVRGQQHRKPWLLWFLALSNVCVNAVVIALILTQCKPTQKLWDQRIPGNCNGRILNQNYAYFQGSYSAVTDAVLALYPIALIWNLQMKLRIKIILCVLMGLGLLAAVCSAIKTAQLTTLSHTDDITYFISPLVLTTSTEAWIILVVGCVPPLRPLVKSLFDKARGSSQNRSKPPGLSYGRGQSLHHGKSHISARGTRNGNTSRAYHSGPAEDTFELKENDSKENIVKDPKTIVRTTNVVVHYEGLDRANSDEANEVIVFDRV